MQALSYLHGLGIAHRDVRSDNLLLNRGGVLKIGNYCVSPFPGKLRGLRLDLADFSNAVMVTSDTPMCTGIVGVIYWQAPEVRTCVD